MYVYTDLRSAGLMYDDDNDVRECCIFWELGTMKFSFSFSFDSVLCFFFLVGKYIPYVIVIVFFFAFIAKKIFFYLFVSAVFVSTMNTQILKLLRSETNKQMNFLCIHVCDKWQSSSSWSWSLYDEMIVIIFFCPFLMVNSIHTHTKKNTNNEKFNEPKFYMDIFSVILSNNNNRKKI